MNSETETPPTAEAPESADPTRLQQWLAEARQAGRYGQAQWQRWIEGLRRAKPEAAEGEAAEAPAGSLAKRLLDSPQVLRAQRRGADLLLSLASAVRAQAEQLERGLKSLGQPVDADAVAH